MPRLVTIWHAVFVLACIAATLYTGLPEWLKLLYMAIIGIIAARLERNEADIRKAEAELNKARAAQAQGARFSAKIAAAEAEARQRMLQWL